MVQVRKTFYFQHFSSILITEFFFPGIKKFGKHAIVNLYWDGIILSNKHFQGGCYFHCSLSSFPFQSSIYNNFSKRIYCPARKESIIILHCLEHRPQLDLEITTEEDKLYFHCKIFTNSCVLIVNSPDTLFP